MKQISRFMFYIFIDVPTLGEYTSTVHVLYFYWCTNPWRVYIYETNFHREFLANDQPLESIHLKSKEKLWLNLSLDLSHHMWWAFFSLIPSILVDDIEKEHCYIQRHIFSRKLTNNPCNRNWPIKLKF
jgi:hypothetical protein